MIMDIWSKYPFHVQRYNCSHIRWIFKIIIQQILKNHILISTGYAQNVGRIFTTPFNVQRISPPSSFFSTFRNVIRSISYGYSLSYVNVQGIPPEPVRSISYGYSLYYVNVQGISPEPARYPTCTFRLALVNSTFHSKRYIQGLNTFYQNWIYSF